MLPALGIKLICYSTMIGQNWLLHEDRNIFHLDTNRHRTLFLRRHPDYDACKGNLDSQFCADANMHCLSLEMVIVSRFPRAKPAWVAFPTVQALRQLQLVVPLRGNSFDRPHWSPSRCPFAAPRGRDVALVQSRCNGPQRHSAGRL